jgi:hypothetical protein
MPTDPDAPSDQTPTAEQGEADSVALTKTILYSVLGFARDNTVHDYMVEIEKLIADHADAAAKAARAEDYELWQSCRDDILHGLDGFDNEQTNAVLSVLDEYEPDGRNVLQCIRSEATRAAREECAKIADDFAVKEHEDVNATGSSICWYSECIADAIRALGGEGNEIPTTNVTGYTRDA